MTRFSRFSIDQAVADAASANDAPEPSAWGRAYPSATRVRGPRPRADRRPIVQFLAGLMNS
jgi:hypothetical protein